jgi:CRP/FNR family transcriptional regulator, cyclic AMP receptor protein
MVSTRRVRFLDAKFELARRLSPDERAELAAVTLPVVEVAEGPLELRAILDAHKAFAVGVLGGLAVHVIQIGEQSGIQLLGPGDVLIQPNADPPSWVEDAAFRAPASMSLTLLGDDFLVAARRAPYLIPALYDCIADQMQRLGSQLVICQLPRVEQRVLAILWLLAETWGHVTPGGVRVPMALTHETLGGLIGARRPTVTLALGKLTEDGSVLRQESGWLLLEPPPEPAGAPRVLAPGLAGISLSRWAPEPEPPADPSDRYAGLTDTVRVLREQHVHDRQELRERLSRVRVARVRMAAMRERISEDVLKRHDPPSS